MINDFLKYGIEQVKLFLIRIVISIHFINQLINRNSISSVIDNAFISIQSIFGTGTIMERNNSVNKSRFHYIM